MTGQMLSAAQRRMRQGLVALGLACVLIVLGILAVWRDASHGLAPDVSGPVLPNWSSDASRAAHIEIETSDAQFALVRQEEGWVMPSRGAFPVRAERIAELDAMFSALKFEQAMTRDPEKFDRLGLGDPQTGGQGVAVTVRDEAGETLAELVLGQARGEDGLYIRRRGGVRAYGVQGPALMLGDPGRWLGLEFWAHEASAIARADIQPEYGPAWQVARAGVSQRFYELRSPTDWRLVTAGAANGVAVAGAQLRFRDVKPAQDLVGAYVARHAAVTFSGLAYEFQFYAEGEARWATISLAALADDAQPRADHFNAQVEGWAFRISEDAYERLTRSLDEVAEPIPGVPAPD